MSDGSLQGTLACEEGDFIPLLEDIIRAVLVEFQVDKGRRKTKFSSQSMVFGGGVPLVRKTKVKIRN